MSLLSPIYLIGLFSIGIPLWLHLMNRENPPIQDFASNTFLEPTPVASSTNKKLRFRKLLLLRLVLLLVLVFLFAEPIVNRLGLWSSVDTKLHALVIDQSFSMRHGDRWAQAIGKAKELLNSLPHGDKALLVTADHNMKLLGDESTDVTSLGNLLNSLKPGYGRLRYDVMIAQLQSLIDEATLPVSVHLFTDAQSSGLSTRIRDLVPGGATEFRVVPVGFDTDKNVFIRSVKQFERQGEGEATVYIEGLDQDEMPENTVSLILDDSSELSRTIEKIPSGENVARFTGLALKKGINRFSLRLNISDALTEDNQYFFAIESGQRYLAHFTSNTKNSNAEVFLRTAVLADDRFVANKPDPMITEIPVETRLIIVPDESALPKTQISKVDQFVRNGGNALVVTGRAIPSSESITDDSVSRSNVESTIGYIDKSHPAIADTASWREIHIFDPVTFKQQPNDRILISLSDGSPFIIERLVGKGRKIIIVSSLDGIQNDLPTSPVFAPFVLRTIRELAGINNGASELTAGSNLVIEPGGQLFSPSGENLVKLSALGKNNRIELNEPGVYEMRSSERSGAITVNADPHESSMERLGSAFLTDWQSLVNDEPDAISKENPQARPDIQKQPIWYGLLTALFVLVILELLYANHLLNIRRGTAS